MKHPETRVHTADIRLSFVKSLYEKRSVLLTGLICHVLVALLVFSASSNPLYLAFAGLLVLVWAVRILDMKRFDRQDFSQACLADITRWERRYVMGAVAACATLGCMTAAVFIEPGLGFSEIATVAVTFATLIAVVGRNFGSRINVDMMVLAVCIPVLCGFLFSGDIYIQLLTLLLFPVFMSTRQLANGVREFLYNSVTAERKSMVVAERLDHALNNMSHGLIMLDQQSQIRVINGRAQRMLGIPQKLNLQNRSYRTVLRYVLRQAGFSDKKISKTKTDLEQLISGNITRLQLNIDQNVYLEFSARHQNNGSVVIIFEDITEKARADKRITYLARYDALTDLPNREWFHERAKHALKNIKHEQKVALAVFDIIDFKHINDTQGHQTGDAILREVAARMKQSSDNDMIISRFGSDEFVIFLFCQNGNSAIEAKMDQLFQTITQPYKIDTNEICIQFAGGIVTQSANKANIEDLHIRADIALATARKKGGNNWVPFSNTMDEMYSERQCLKTDLRKAVDDGALDIAYQPMFTPDGLKIVGAEALSRWNHPTMGPISPAIYIKLAEELGIMRKLTQMMISQATRDCKNWPDPMFVSVNLSAYDLIDTDILTIIGDALETTGLKPSRLHLEVTESAVIDDPDFAASLLTQMRKMGMSIAIDDFGTGYSSLSYLDKLPINKVKIDRSFVKNIVDDERKVRLLRGIVNMSRELGFDIVTEGIETHDQLKLICANDCADLIQGFLFGTPMPQSALVELARKISNSTLVHTPNQQRVI